MKSRKLLYLSITFVLLSFIPHSIFADRQYTYKKVINEDSLAQEITVSVGQERLASILSFCQNFMNRNPRKCLEYSQEGIEIAGNLQDKHAKLLLLERVARANTRTGDLEEALATIKETIRLAEIEKDSIVLGKIYIAYSIYSYTRGLYAVSIEQGEKAIQIAQKINNPRILFNAKSALNYNHLVLGEHSTAIGIYDELLLLGKKHGFDCGPILVNKASALNYMGRLPEALDLFFQLRETFKAQKNPYGCAMVEHHIGFLLKNIDMKDEALKYFLSVEEFFQHNGDIYYLSHIKMSLGEIMLKKGRLEEAEAYVNESLLLKQDNGMQNLSDHFSVLGEIALARDSIRKAIGIFQIALDASNKIENPADMLACYNYLSTCYIRLKEYENSIKYAQNALSADPNSEVLEELLISYENLFNSYLALGESALAIEAKSKRDSVKEKMIGPAELMQITRQVVLETLKENSAEERNLDSKNNVDSSSFVKLGILAFLLIIAILSFLYYRISSRKNKHLKKEYLASQEISELLPQLELVIKEQKPYLNPSLTLRDLAALIPTTDKKLSALLNQTLGTNFYDYLNKFRVEAFQEKWVSGEYKNYSIVGLAELCGFSSKSSFYRAFKKETGISPSEFMKKAP